MKITVDLPDAQAVALLQFADRLNSSQFDAGELAGAVGTIEKAVRQAVTERGDAAMRDAGTGADNLALADSLAQARNEFQGQGRAE